MTAFNSDLARSVIVDVLRAEGRALNELAASIDPAFVTAVQWLVECPGRVITCGIGKSGHIARKTAGTLSSTGTPSLFLHAAEAVHGDLGKVTADDIVLLYSHSGETDEVVNLFVPLGAIGARTILMTGRAESSAGRAASLVLDTGVREEACPNNLAPTTSTTAMLALSDALAIAAMTLRGFTREDFARYHPSGALGKRLLLTVGDVMRSGDDVAMVQPADAVVTVMRAITAAGAGAACVVDERRHLLGFISDGDLRRWFLESEDPRSGTASDMMNPTRWTLEPELMAIEALEVFQNLAKKVGEMPVVDADGTLLGLLVLKDLLRCGIV
ncbi:MAG: KpsF/GutQ family sugar-phosphate isomerase [Chthonomonas sp.]|nr:KpsF/GutQ family sugar-phosphate isomerase [Chthonomonas sp.]